MTQFNAAQASILVVLYLTELQLIPQFRDKQPGIVANDGTIQELSPAGRDAARDFITALGFNPDALTESLASDLLRIVRTINRTTHGSYETNN